MNEMRSIENLVRAMLRGVGIRLGTPSRTAFAGRARKLVDVDAEVMAIVEPLLSILGVMLEEFARLTKRVLDIVRKEKVGPRLRLTPARYQSGATDLPGKVSREGDELACTVFYEAANTLLVRSKNWSSLKAWGMNIAKRHGMVRAGVAVTRKLAVILHRVEANATEFRFGTESTTLAA